MTPLTGNDRILAGRYRLGALLGRGAMAEVFDGVDTRLERPVAVKVLRGDSVLGPEGRARFSYEARAAARLSHPHSVAIYDSGTDGDIAYIVMERLPGTTMADYLQGGPLAVGWVMRIAADVLDALGAAHAAGLTHRDIKPGNILITPDDRAKVADFGIAKLTDTAGDLTATGLVVGTAAYLPPERIDGRPASPQGDLYAVGVVLYEALAGRKPFTGDSPIAVAYAARHATPPDLAALRPDLSSALVAAVAKAMAPAPEARFATAGEMAGALRAAAAEPLATTPIVAGPALAPTEVWGAAAGAAPALTDALHPADFPGSSPEQAARRRKALLLAGAVAVLVAAIILAVATSPRGTTRSRASPTVAPTTVAPTTVAPTTAPVSTVASDPQVAALQAAAAALAASGGGGSQAAALLRQVAALPASVRPAAATAAEAALKALHDAGVLTDQQYQQALAPLLSLTGGGQGGGGTPVHGGGKGGGH